MTRGTPYHDASPPPAAPPRRTPRHATTTPIPAPREVVALLDGQRLSYTVRVSARARRLCLRIHPPGTLEVVVPRRTSQARIDAVLREKASWIRATLARMERAAATAPAPVPLADGSVLVYAGREIRLAVRTGAPAARVAARLSGDTLELRVADASDAPLRAALEAWYRRQARVVFAERLALHNAAYGFEYGRVAIKEQKSRWGSCSRLGNLNFNWRLLLAPLAVLDYVVIHELCHLKELNHSPRFWLLVARACPDYATHRRWLRLHGHELRF